jgi:hypothetical protein
VAAARPLEPTPASLTDLLKAKQALSARLLRAGLRGGVTSRGPALTVASAIAGAPYNVHAVGVGRKIVEGSATPTPAVRLYVVQKLAESLLPPKDRLPKTVDGFPTDVIESPPGIAAAAACSSARKSRQRPLLAGISAAHHEVTAGTIACFCRSTRHGDDPAAVFALSNNHIFARLNGGLAGDDLYQPSAQDGGTAADHFAELHRFVPLSLGGQTPNRVDAAIARVVDGTAVDNSLCSIGRITGTMAAADGMVVRKHGRTTGYTEGIVTDVSYNALILLDPSNPGTVALFENQLRISVSAPFFAFALKGDSGSLVVTKESTNAVGLYFAGPPSGDYGVANPIAAVQAELAIALLT